MFFVLVFLNRFSMFESTNIPIIQMSILPYNTPKESQEESSEEFDLIFRHFYKFVFTTAFFILKDEEETEDLVQGFFIDLWEKKKYMQLDEDMKGYLYIAIRNKALNRIRNRETERKRQDVYYLDAEKHPDMADGMDDYLLNLKEALYELPVQRREAIQLVYLNEKKYREAADVMGISINSLKTHLKIGLRNLRNRLKGRGSINGNI